MTLTKDQRYIVYCILSEEICISKFTGICVILDEMVSRKVGGSFGFRTDLCEILPELYAKKTGLYNMNGEQYFQGRYWFKDKLERIAALEQCIYETHPDNPKNKRK